jgi:hypothetical protein
MRQNKGKKGIIITFVFVFAIYKGGPYVSWSDKSKIIFVFVFVVDKVEGKCDKTGEKRGVIITFVFCFCCV